MTAGTARAKRRSWRRGVAAFAVLAIVLSGLLVAVQRVTARLAGAGGVAALVGEDTPATAMNLYEGAGNDSPTIVADPRQPQFAVIASRIDIPDFSCALELSGDGGRSWISGNPVPDLPPGAEKCYAPEAAFDRHGRLYYLFVGLAGGGNQPMGVYLTMSTDHGATFSQPRMILGEANFSVRMLIDPTVGATGRIHLVWLHAGEPPPLGGFPTTPNPILSSYSDDMGATFSKPIQVNPPEQQRALAPALALGPDHQVDVAYYDLRDDARDYRGLEGPVWDGTWSLMVSTSTDGGRSFGRPQTVTADIATTERIMLVFTMPPPSLVAWAGHLCLAWADARHGDPDVLARCSASGHWGRIVRVNTDRVGNGHRQYLPRLAVSPDGRLDIVYLDRPDPINRYNSTVYAYSTDGGKSFRKPITISQHVSDTRIGAQYGVVSAAGQVEFGSRLGILSTRNTVLAAWPDTRNSTLDSTSQDIFATRIVIRHEAFWWDRASVAIALGVALAIALTAFSRRRFRRSGPAGTIEEPAAPGDSAAGAPEAAAVTTTPASTTGRT